MAATGSIPIVALVGRRPRRGRVFALLAVLALVRRVGRHRRRLLRDHLDELDLDALGARHGGLRVALVPRELHVGIARIEHNNLLRPGFTCTLEFPHAIADLVLSVQVVRSVIIGTEFATGGERRLRYESGLAFLNLKPEEQKLLEDIIERLINRAVLKVFDRYVKLEALKPTVAYFSNGWGMRVSDTMSSSEYLEDVRNIPGLSDAIKTLGAGDWPALIASAAEFILEGLHLHQKLNKEREGGRYTYRA